MRGREYHHAAEAFTLIGAFARIQLIYVTLAYDTDDLRERQRLADEGERAYVRATGAWQISPARRTYPALAAFLEEWAEAEQLIAGMAQVRERAVGRAQDVGNTRVSSGRPRSSVGTDSAGASQRSCHGSRRRSLPR